jgi:ABC-type branched-subunit amino acid transport system ATPase component
VSTTPVLRLTGITKRFGPLVANDAISLELHAGEILALLGENGAGKSTLVSILFGHYTADEGSIEIFGKPLAPGNPRAALEAGIGMVHQHFTLADNLSVLDNVMMGSEPLWQPFSRRSAARAKLLDVAQRFGLPVAPEAKVGSLSVGERQRVEILKALYRGARILILDEPTAVLTPQESEALFDTLGQMVAQGFPSSLSATSSAKCCAYRSAWPCCAAASWWPRRQPPAPARRSLRSGWSATPSRPRSAGPRWRQARRSARWTPSARPTPGATGWTAFRCNSRPVRSSRLPASRATGSLRWPNCSAAPEPPARAR